MPAQAGGVEHAVGTPQRGIESGVFAAELTALTAKKRRAPFGRDGMIAAAPVAMTLVLAVVSAWEVPW